MKKFAINDWIEYEDPNDPLGEKRLGVVTTVPNDGGQKRFLFAQYR